MLAEGRGFWDWMSPDLYHIAISLMLRILRFPTQIPMARFQALLTNKTTGEVLPVACTRVILLDPGHGSIHITTMTALLPQPTAQRQDMCDFTPGSDVSQTVIHDVVQTVTEATGVVQHYTSSRHAQQPGSPLMEDSHSPHRSLVSSAAVPWNVDA